MKESIITGRRIFEEIQRIQQDLKDLNIALDSIEDEIGKDSIAYTLLAENRDNKRKELNALMNAIYRRS